MYMVNSVLVVTGMNSCEKAKEVKETLMATDGVAAVNIKWPIHEVKVQYDSDIVDAHHLTSKLECLGYNIGGIL